MEDKGEGFHGINPLRAAERADSPHNDTRRPSRSIGGSADRRSARVVDPQAIERVCFKYFIKLRKLFNYI